MTTDRQDPRAARAAVPTTAELDRGFERLLAALTSRCEAAAPLEGRIEVALRGAFGLLAEDPELAATLCAEPRPTGDGAFADARDDWLLTCADLLRDAGVESAGAVAPPRFLEPLIVGGAWRIVSERVHKGAAGALPGLAPELAAVLAVYYRPESQALVEEVTDVRGDAPRRGPRDGVTRLSTRRDGEASTKP